MNIPSEHLPDYYRPYVDLVRDFPLKEALQISEARMTEWIEAVGKSRADYAYAPGKWTVKELLCHLTDAERVFVYRALRFSRNDQTPLPPFDENLYVPNSNAAARSIESITEEMHYVRLATIAFFESCTNEMLNRTGPASGKTMSALALGYITAGHQMHHLNILIERYSK